MTDIFYQLDETCFLDSSLVTVDEKPPTRILNLLRISLYSRSFNNAKFFNPNWGWARHTLSHDDSFILHKL